MKLGYALKTPALFGMRIPDKSIPYFASQFRETDSVVLSCHLLHTRATSIDAWKVYGTIWPKTWCRERQEKLQG